MKKKILFISHEASRTGAPIFLLNFLRWLKANSDMDFWVLIREGGDLQTDFEKIAPVLIFSKYNQMRKAPDCLTIFYSLLDNMRRIYLKWKLSKANIALIYSNTIVNGNILNFLRFLDSPVVSHIHELEYIISSFGQYNLQLVKERTSQYIAASESVKDGLIKNYGIPENKIETISECITLHNLKSYKTRESLCRELNIPQESYIICSAGTCEWRKSPDLFIQLAKIIKKRFSKEVYFLWVGSLLGKELEIAYDIKKLNLEKYVHFLGVKHRPIDYFAACDIFVSVSREEPFGIASVEAGFSGKPIICFDKTGGQSEIVEEDAGFVVPYLDLETMAERVVTLLNCPEMCHQMGQRAKQKTIERYDVEIIGPKIVNVILKMTSLVD